MSQKPKICRLVLVKMYIANLLYLFLQICYMAITIYT